MTLFEFLYKIEEGYIQQRPNLKEMQRRVAGLGWTVEYKYGFFKRWWEWVKYYDCEYVLNRKYDDMRNYTA